VDTGRYNVLLIDDDLAQIDLARRAAAESCPEIILTAVGGGDAVLDWFSASVEKKEQMPHIILLDLKLPKLDGLAVLRKLRMHDVTRDIPIVVFSAEYTHDDMLMSYQVGANTFVAKPTDLAQFSKFLCEQMEYWMHPRQRKLIFTAKDGATE
jgi:two-component system, response regulator